MICHTHLLRRNDPLRCWKHLCSKYQRTVCIWLILKSVGYHILKNCPKEILIYSRLDWIIGTLLVGSKEINVFFMYVMHFFTLKIYFKNLGVCDIWIFGIWRASCIYDHLSLHKIVHCQFCIYAYKRIRQYIFNAVQF